MFRTLMRPEWFYNFPNSTETVNPRHTRFLWETFTLKKVGPRASLQGSGKGIFQLKYF